MPLLSTFVSRVQRESSPLDISLLGWLPIPHLTSGQKALARAQGMKRALCLTTHLPDY